jgi:1-deoxy-D-xylulose-5-phosphate synthase
VTADPGASLLAAISSPADLKALAPAMLPKLAEEIREHLVRSVSRAGGHLGPNLGVVELTIALHRVFDSPRDVLLWDTGHQAYVHKMLTGRAGAFDTLRQAGGLSGYPSRAESAHDVIENSHASTALSYADGLAKAFELRGEQDRAVVPVVGDGALTGVMCWEALNNIAGSDRAVVIVVNDNGRSYAPTIGGFAQHLAALRLLPEWEAALSAVKRTVPRTPLVGKPAYAALHGVKQGLKDLLAPQALFEDLGLKYVGPIDGHDVEAVEAALRRARSFGSPVVVHCVTRKGCGYPPAENDEADCLHGVGAIDPATGKSLATGAALPWTQVFADEVVALAREDDRVVGITAAMMRPVGLQAFAAEFPHRVFDVGIAEQHAVTSAAGLAVGGLHPIVCVYATFLNRAFDQVLMDVALHKLPVTLVLDRAGVTGEDGASHHGMWDLAVLGVVPGMRVAAPRDAARLRELLREAVAVRTGPTALRFPKAQAGSELAAVGRIGPVDVLRAHVDADVLIISVGPLAADAVAAAELLAARGIAVTVVDPRWVLPVDPSLTQLASAYRLVITVEDGVVDGGIGDAVARALRRAESGAEVLSLGLDRAFVPHGARPDILRAAGLDAAGIAAAVSRTYARESDKHLARSDAVAPVHAANWGQ